MPFKKLNTPIKEALERFGFDTPLDFQKKILSKIKSGANVYGIGAKDSGKTTTAIISTLQKLKCIAFEDVPRAILIVNDKKEALALEQKFNEFKVGTDIRVYAAYEELGIDVQKEQIYDGVDIVIATPKRLNKLYLQNAINLNKVQLLIVDNAEVMVKERKFGNILRITQSLSKCQYIIFARIYDNRFNEFEDTFMTNPIRIG